jgi:hypothetical protein
MDILFKLVLDYTHVVIISLFLYKVFLFLNYSHFYLLQHLVPGRVKQTTLAI